MTRKAKIWTVIACLAAAAGVARVTWEHVLEKRVVPLRWGVIEEGRAYRSGQLTRWLVEETLSENEIDVIVDLRQPDPEDPDQAAEAAAAKALGIEHAKFPLLGDGTGDVESYARAIERLARAVDSGETTLVHCEFGSQRTGGVVAAYRVLVQGETPEEAMREMRRYDWHPRKHGNVTDYLNRHLSDIATRLAESGVIEKVPDPLPVFEP